MKADRLRKLTLKDINRELKLYLRAYDRRHPHYKRNIKNLYEGLVELGILDYDHSEQTFKQFQVAFQKADKGLKMAMITSHLFNTPNLGTFFEYQGRPIQGIKMIGGIFVSKAPSKLLNEKEYINYLEKKKKQWLLKREKEDLADLERGLEQLYDFKVEKLQIREKLKLTDAEIKEINKQDREIARVLKKYLTQIKEIADTHGLKLAEDIESKVLQTKLKNNAQVKLEIVAEIKAIQAYLKQQLKQKSLNLDNYEKFASKQMEHIKLREDIDNLELKNLAALLKQTQSLVQEQVEVEVKEEIPNLVKGFTDVVELRKQLKQFIAYLDEKRVNLRDPWDIVEYVSPRRRSHNPVTRTLGEGMEGFAMRDFNLVRRKLEAYFEVFNAYADIVPQSNLKNSLYDLVNGLLFLTKEFDNVPEFFEQQIETDDAYKRDDLGHIVNIHEHPRTIELFQKIQDYMGQDIANAQKTLAASEQIIEYNEDLVKQAKLTVKTARQQLNKLKKSEDKINQLIARRKIQKQNEE